ncbi:MAG: hypothetical protein ABL888_20465 [Pirellulaceae bacterium]
MPVAANAVMQIDRSDDDAARKVFAIDIKDVVKLHPLKFFFQGVSGLTCVNQNRIPDFCGTGPVFDWLYATNDGFGVRLFNA